MSSRGKSEEIHKASGTPAHLVWQGGARRGLATYLVGEHKFELWCEGRDKAIAILDLIGLAYTTGRYDEAKGKRTV